MARAYKCIGIQFSNKYSRLGSSASVCSTKMFHTLNLSTVQCHLKSLKIRVIQVHRGVGLKIRRSLDTIELYSPLHRGVYRYRKRDGGETYIIGKLKTPSFHIFEVARKKLQTKCTFKHFSKMAAIRIMKFL